MTNPHYYKKPQISCMIYYVFYSFDRYVHTEWAYMYDIDGLESNNNNI